MVKEGLWGAPDRNRINWVAEPDAAPAVGDQVVGMIMELAAEPELHDNGRPVAVEPDDAPGGALAPVKVAFGIEAKPAGAGRVSPELCYGAGGGMVPKDAALIYEAEQQTLAIPGRSVGRPAVRAPQLARRPIPP